MPLSAADVLAIVRERHALERLDAVIAQRMTDPSCAAEWHYARVAIADRLKWVDYGASCATPEQLAHADAIVEAERVAAEVFAGAKTFTPRDWQLAWQSAS